MIKKKTFHFNYFWIECIIKYLYSIYNFIINVILTTYEKKITLKY